MRKLLTILFLCLTLCLSGQILPGVVASRPAVVGGSYTTQYQTFLNAMTVDPTGDTLTWQNDMVVSLAAGGYWARMDFLYILAQRNWQGATLDWITPAGSNTITDGNSTTFTKYNGFIGNSTDDYLNTNWNDSTENVNVHRFSATIGVWMLHESNEDRYALGVANAAPASTMQIWVRSNGDNQMYAGVSSSTRLINANATGIGLALATRRSYADVENYMNGASLGANTHVSSATIPNGNVYLLARNYDGTAGAFSGNEIAIAFMMNGITDAEATAIYDIFHHYMTHIGL